MKVSKLVALLMLMLCSGVAVAQQWGVKTNLPYAATRTPNLGVELAVGKRSTIELTGGLNPFRLNHGQKMWKHWLATASYRYWFCDVYNGHFVGVHALGGQFNVNGLSFSPMGFESNKRNQGWGIGAGVSYGYQWVLSRRWNLEAELGLGFVHLDYERFGCKTCGKKIDDRTKDYLGVTKAGISLVYMLK